jgi:hypothetical protein
MLEVKLNQVRQSIEAALPRFLEVRKPYFTEDELVQLREVVDAKRPLYEFRNSLRQAIVRNLEKASFDSTPFWAMVDAINFYVEVETRHWPNATEASLEQSLLWATAELDKALSHGLPAEGKGKIKWVKSSSALNMIGPYLSTEVTCPFCDKRNVFLFLETEVGPIKSHEWCQHVHARLIDADGENQFEFHSDD